MTRHAPHQRLGRLLRQSVFVAAIAALPFAASAQGVQGCGVRAATDPVPLDHVPARCEPGFPSPKPLAKRGTMRMAVGLPSAEYFAPIAIGLQKGEFEKENLDLQIVVMPGSDALQLMAARRLDADWASVDATFLNAVSQGFELAWTVANFSSSPENKAGLWAQKGTTLKDLKGKIIASVQGPGSTSLYPLMVGLKNAGMTTGDLTLQRFEMPLHVMALKNKAVQATWLQDPLWVQFVNDPEYVFLQGQPAGEPLGGALFGPTLLKDNREVGTAFMRAYVRIVSTYFNGDYKKDDTFMADLSKALKVPVETLRGVPSNVWDWEIRSGTGARLQEALLPSKALTYTEPMPESKIVDRSFYQEVVGIKR